MNRKNDITLKWLGHSSFKITIGNEIFYFDPIRKNKLLGTTLNPKKEDNVTAIFISHEHWDHCDDSTVRQLGNLKTRIIGPEIALSNLFFPSMTYEFDSVQEMGAYFSKKKAYVHHAKPGDLIEFKTCSVKCMAATEGLYYLITGKKKILFMGDSIATKEMMKETTDVILFPVWAVKGEEAKPSEFFKLAKGSLCIPMHYHTSPAESRGRAKGHFD